MLKSVCYKYYLCFLLVLQLLCLDILPARAQYFDLDSSKKHVSIPFKLIRNMVVITLRINNKGPFNFILDTGVGLMIITEPSLVDSINLSGKRTIRLFGLGEGDDYEAYSTTPLKIDIPGLVSHGVCAAILKKDHFGLSSYAGIPIHGLLGYDFFNNLAVKLNFQDSILSVCRPKDLHFKNAFSLPITIEERKPYFTASITLENGDKIQSKLVIDLGAGHPVSLEHVIRQDGKGLPQKFIAANLGVGLNGPISGFLGRINQIDIGKYKIKNVITSFPVNDSLQTMIFVKRDGNLGIGILKKFNVVFDYPDNMVYLKPDNDFKEPFEHDMSGLEYYATGDDFNHVIISRVEPGSAGALVGLEKNDEIVSINFKPVSKMSLEEIDELFRSKDDRSLLLEVFHDNKYDNVIMTLKRRI